MMLMVDVDVGRARVQEKVIGCRLFGIDVVLIII